jgi:hypothetical protein
MNKCYATILLAALVTGISATAADAAVIRYTFVDTVFEDGGTVSGFFDWDTNLADITSVYDGGSVNFDVSVAGGNETDFPPFTYTDEVEGPMQDGGQFGAFKPVLVVGNVFGPSDRELNFVPDGVVAVIGVDLNIPLSSDTYTEATNVSGLEFRNVTGGSLVGTVIPEPASVALLAIGGLLTIFRGRGRRQLHGRHR